MIVVDASVAVQWVAEEDNSALSETLLVRDDLCAPDLLLVEVANALRRKIWVGDISFEQAKAGLAFIREKVRLIPVGAELLEQALELSHEMYHPIYDCIYAAMARAEGALLATYDEDLMKGLARQNLGHVIGKLPLGTP